jgi:hypothetical protein
MHWTKFKYFYFTSWPPGKKKKKRMIACYMCKSNNEVILIINPLIQRGLLRRKTNLKKKKFKILEKRGQVSEQTPPIFYFAFSPCTIWCGFLFFKDQGRNWNLFNSIGAGLYLYIFWTGPLPYMLKLSTVDVTSHSPHKTVPPLLF